jgi:hypothetical protein
VLQRQCCDPDIITWDRFALHAQLVVDRRVVQRCAFVRRQDLHVLIFEKLTQPPFVLSGSASVEKPGAQFPNDDQGKEHVIGVFDVLLDDGVAAPKVSVAVAVQRQPHCQSSGSIRSISFIASSNPGSFT